MLAGGLFEDGSLFDDGPPPSLPASERVPESHYDNGGGVLDCLQEELACTTGIRAASIPLCIMSYQLFC